MASLFRTLREMGHGLFSSPSRAYPFWLFLGLAALIAYYDFREVPNREAQILRTDFGFLASESDQLKSVLETYVAMLTTEVQNEKHAHNDKDPHWTIGPHFFEELNYKAQAETDLFVDCTASPPVKDPPSTEPRTEEIVLFIKTDNPLAIARVEFHDSDPSHNRCLNIPLADAADRIIGKHMDQFDSVAVALSSGEVLHQRAHNGFRLANIGNLLEAAYRPKDTSSPLLATTGVKPQTPLELSQPQDRADWRQVSYTTLIEADFETDPYRLLVQPIPLPIGLRGSTSTIQPTLLLIGVVSQSRLTSRARRPSLTEVAPLVVLLLLILLALWPVLKVWKMAPADGFKITELLFLACSLLGAVAIVSLVTSYVLTRLDTSSIDEQLSTLTQEIDKHFADELAEALGALDFASNSPLLGDDLSCADRIRRLNKPPYRSRPDILAPSKASPGALPSGDPCELAPASHTEDVSTGLRSKYPWVDQLTWANGQSEQVVKWSAHKYTTNPISIKSFVGPSLFSRLQARDLWTLADHQDRKFLLAPIHSPLTGKYLPVILKPYDVIKEPPDVRAGVKFAAISSYLISVTDATLPPDFGFAIIDEDGVVQFHSDAARNLGETLVNRIQPPAPLRRAIHERDAVAFDAQYLDGPVRMHAAPLRKIRGCPWTLVTWYDLQERERFLATVFGLSMCLIIVYCVYVIVVCVVLYAATTVLQMGQSDEWHRLYLPTVDNLPNLLMVVLCYTVLGCVYIAIIRSHDVVLLTVSILVVPFVVAIVTWIIVGVTIRPVPQWIEHSKIAPFTFVLAISCGAVLLGALPALSFAELCWEQISPPRTIQDSGGVTLRERYVRDAQIRLHRSLHDRRHSIKGELLTVTGADGGLVTERLGSNLDRYDLAFFNVDKSGAGGGLTGPADGRNQRPVRYSASGGWTWQVEDGRDKDTSDWLVMRRSPGFEDPEETQDERLVTSPLPRFPFRWPRALAALGVGALVICLAVWRTLFHRFQWGHEMPADVGTVRELVPGCNRLVLAHPWQDAGGLLASGIDAGVCSVVEALATDGWQAGGGAFVIITGLEEGLRSREAASRTLRMLEGLLSLPDKTVILTCAVNPILWLTEGTPGETHMSGGAYPVGELARWLSALSGFVMGSLCDLSDQRLTARRCHLLWRCCSAREKLVLWHLVKYGLPNPKNNSALDSLIQRGLVSRRDTRFYVVSKELTDFVRSDLPRREVETLFPPDADSAWRGLRWVLIYTFILIFVVIVFSYVELWGSPVVRVLTLGGAALPILKTAFDILPKLGRKSVISA